MGSVIKTAGKEVVLAKPVDQRQLLRNQERAILDTTELLCVLMKGAGVSRSELARRMGTTKGNVTQILDGSRNLTIRTVSDLMTQLGHEFKASCKAREVPERHAVVRFVAEIRIPMTGVVNQQRVMPESFSFVTGSGSGSGVAGSFCQAAGV